MPISPSTVQYKRDSLRNSSYWQKTGTEDESIDKEDILDVLTVKLCTKNQSIRLFRPLEN